MARLYAWMTFFIVAVINVGLVPSEVLSLMQHTEAFEKLVSEIKSQVREISTGEVLEKLERKEPFRFVDVREDHEWLAGHARGAEHIGRGIIERDIEKLIPDYGAPIVLYCGGGYRSALAAVNIQKMGYTNVLSMAGGIRKWREEELPEEKPPEGAVPYTAPYAK